MQGVIFDRKQNVGMVWDLELISKLQDSRIIGTFHTNTTPMFLSLEQVKVASELNFSIYTAQYTTPTSKQIEAYESSKQQEKLDFNEKRIEYKLILKQIYVDKLTISIPDKPEIPQEIDINSNKLPWYTQEIFNINALKDIDRSRYEIFKYFYDKQFYITNGLKFGGDYLLYTGHPDEFHSVYIVSIVELGDLISCLDLISYTRLATNVNKIKLFAAWDRNEGIVKVFSSQWTTWV